MTASDQYKLYTASGSGGMIVEIAFGIADLDVDIVDVSWDDLGWDSNTLKELNPLGQLPTVVMPGGEVLTETAAIIQHIADVRPESGLVPAKDHPQRNAYLRWLTFLVSAVYPTFTYGDVPKRWVDGNEEAGKLLRSGTDEHRKALYQYLERFCGEPWFLGDTFSAVDLYFWPMRHWRPGAGWFDGHCPKLAAVANKVDALPIAQFVAKRNKLGD